MNRILRRTLAVITLACAFALPAGATLQTADTASIGPEISHPGTASQSCRWIMILGSWYCI